MPDSIEVKGMRRMIGGFNISGRSTDLDRSDGKVLGLVERYAKGRKTSNLAGHGGNLTGVYPDAIEFQRVCLTGAGGRYLAECFAMAVLFNWAVVEFALEGLLRYRGYGTLVFGLLGPWMFFIFFAYLELFAPADSPIYFDRKHRKVYKVLQSGARRWGFFGPRKSRLVAYDWDLVDAEHHTTLQASTATASRVHHFVFLVRKSEGDPTIADHFTFAGVDFVPELWEYIRRYMENGAAPLVQNEFPPVSNMGAYVPWSDFGAVVPFLDQPGRRWKEQPWKTLFRYIGMPVTVPLYVLWLFFNRLTVWTAQKVEWPQQIVDAIGPLVTEQDLRTDAYRRLRPGPPPEM
ncbi:MULTISPECIES: DUF6708 domain-containing protein [unclassified Variovorax]|uniref:DUF6708 domain-containing protein n=1 Tax=unclassified Variovorax TaxID=663243 RepID=UPI001160D42E|nr:MULTISPECIES: DUF6708 domain-containing protein [unclassified Variovorax]